MTDQPLRVGDTDRLAAANQLAAHTAAGRLTLAEHDQRVGAVWAARTRADLDVLFADLPAIGQEPGRAGLPGATTVISILAVVAVLAAWLAAMAHPAWASNLMAGCM
jgi:hypothetical protein